MTELKGKALNIAEVLILMCSPNYRDDPANSVQELFLHEVYLAWKALVMDVILREWIKLVEFVSVG
jgi:hypothetical protein